jgi:hypothetical protein
MNTHRRVSLAEKAEHQDRDAADKGDVAVEEE